MASKKFDIRSAEPVLYYVGPGHLAGVPADDLSANVLARLARDESDAAIAAIRDELVATGLYASRPVTPAEEPTDD